MAKNNVPGRLNREQNPRPGQPEPGFNSQFYDKDGYATDVDENNPYPVANYALHGNIWLPVSEVNPMPTQLIGSNVEDVLELRDIQIEAGATVNFLNYDENVHTHIKVLLYRFSSNQLDFVVRSSIGMHTTVAMEKVVPLESVVSRLFTDDWVEISPYQTYIGIKNKSTTPITTDVYLSLRRSTALNG